jgi:hypothetical protein
VLGLIATLLLPACGKAPSDEHVVNDPVRLEPIEGTDRSRVVLTAEAAERLDIQTAPVESTAQGTAILAAAVLYDPNGEEWAYTEPEPLVFVREPITVDRLDADVAMLSGGPPPGTKVVTVGVAELYGAEHEVGH